MRERELLDNIQLRKKQKEIGRVDVQLKEAKEELGDINPGNLERDRKRLLTQQDELIKEVSK